MPRTPIVILVSYLIGAIPTAYIFGRLLKGIDIRNFGSGNPGATNAMRVLGKPAGIAVLILDSLKGFIPIALWGQSEGLSVILGLACICGHNWTIFLKFKGGKGIAATLGVLIGLSTRVPGLKIVLLLAILTWLLVFLTSRIVSLASILSAASLPVYMLVCKQSAVLKLLSVLLCISAILRHKSNLKRLISGEEFRVGKK